MARDEMRRREDLIIEAFCRTIAILDGQTAVVVERPDRTDGSGGCEALLRRLDRSWALEHTTFDSFPDQRLDNARLFKVLNPSARRIAAAFPEWRITIGVPIGAVRAGIPWSTLQAVFEEEVAKALKSVSGETAHMTVELPGLFEVTILCRRGHTSGCFISRDAPLDNVATRAEVIANSLAGKARQMAPYVARGMPTVLLLDNDDIGLMEPYSAAESFARCADGKALAPFTEIYVVDSSESPPWFFPVKLGARLHPLPEFRLFHERQFYLTYEG